MRLTVVALSGLVRSLSMAGTADLYVVRQSRQAPP
jgi:hypothetical protein